MYRMDRMKAIYLQDFGGLPALRHSQCCSKAYGHSGRRRKSRRPVPTAAGWPQKGSKGDVFVSLCIVFISFDKGIPRSKIGCKDTNFFRRGEIYFLGRIGADASKKTNAPFGRLRSIAGNPISAQTFTASRINGGNFEIRIYFNLSRVSPLQGSGGCLSSYRRLRYAPPPGQSLAPLRGLVFVASAVVEFHAFTIVAMVSIISLAGTILRCSTSGSSS